MYSIFPLFRCQGVWNKTWTQLSVSQILFQNPTNYSLGDVPGFCYHSWCDSTVIFFIKPTMFISVWADFGWPPFSWLYTSSLPSRNQEYHLKTFELFRPWFPQAVCTNITLSVANRPGLKQNFMEILSSFPPSMTYKENWLYKTSCNFTRQVVTSTLSKINERNSVCERMLVDSA